jgi:NAD(P)-dependent dehydrogenase (short-subunit alcohol dehydrogenase family)
MGPERMSGGAVLVTGASTGIGEACAVELDRRGYTVFAGVRRDEDGARLKQEASRALVPVRLDITDAGDVAAVVKTIDAAVGRAGLRAVVNNAGVARGGPLEYLPLDDWRLQFEINVIGQVAVTQAVLPLLRLARGTIVFIGSTSGRISTPLMGPYGASKHAMEAIAESLRHELHDAGIRVALVEPGAVKTAIWDKGRALADEVEKSLPGEAAERYAGHIKAVRKGIEDQERVGIAPSAVAAVVLKAIESPRPRARYLVGRDALAIGVASRFLPDRVRDVLVAKLVGP